MSKNDNRRNKLLLCWLVAAAMMLFATVNLAAQSSTTGDVSGVVSDPTGAVVPGATVTLKSVETGRTSSAKSNNSGVYRFSLLSPGAYTITVSSANFNPASVQVYVSLGQATAANVSLQLASQQQTVEVTAEGSVIQTDDGNISTTMSQAMIENQPNPGNDLTYIAQTAPGAVMNTQNGYGNFSSFGLPGTSNLFTSNGMNDNDPFLNLNNSGATNQMLGTNDAREVTVVNNGYSVEYGGLAGSNVNIVSKSGSNQWHGNAQYFYNWDGLNANNWFNDATGTPKPHAVANQWAASFGGPIKNDKSFFFVNTEGLYLAIPTSTTVLIPSAPFQAATLASIPASQVPTYNQIFSLYNNAPGASRAVASGPPGTSAGCPTGYTVDAAGDPCSLQFRSTAGDHTHEWIISGRYDENLTNSDRAFIHFRMDQGLQATYTDPLSSAFNIESKQPQYEGQLNLNHTFGSNAVNQFIVAGSYYRAIFTVPSETAATAAFPFSLNFAGNTFYPIGGPAPVFTDSNQNGRNVTQYQISDDYSRHFRNQDLKFGVNFVRNDVTDYKPLQFSLIGLEPGEALTDFQAGNATLGYTQQFPANGRLSAPIALYNLGLYAQDETRLRKNLKITIGLRADHYSNPVCQINCFARYANSFDAISHNPAQPYNQAILYNQHQALNNFDSINWSPRLGFAWTPYGLGSSFVVRGGIGIFFDRFPATVADDMLTNPPFNNGFVVGTIPPGISSIVPAGLTVPLSAAPATAAAANTAFTNGFSSGGTLASLSTNPFFSAPSFFNPAGSLHSPQYQEWNLQIEQGLGPNMTLSINYVGNHGLHETWTNIGPNGFDPNGFGGLPLTAPDPRFSTVQEVQTSALSNYNGVTVSLSRRMKSFQFQFNYSWSHALDEISNGGILEYNLGDNLSVLNPQNPFNLRQYNYGNADYDTRHYASLNYVWTTPKMKHAWMDAVGGWTIAGNAFARTGYPFTVVDSGVSSTLFGQNFFSGLGPIVFANQVASGSFSCGASAAITPCPVMLSSYTPTSYGPGTANTWGNQRRNQIYGPSYINTNLTIMKNFRFPHWETSKLALGAQFFNILNHPNFDQPIGDIANTAQFGTIQRTVNTPTSMYGSFLGADASARQIQLRATLNF
jgi:hypothetical protein